MVSWQLPRETLLLEGPLFVVYAFKPNNTKPWMPFNNMKILQLIDSACSGK